MSATLVSSLEQAGEGSRELDALIADLFDPVPDQYDGFAGRWPFADGSAFSDQTPPVTTSLDAALALAERVLDGDFSYDLFHDFGGFNVAKVMGITEMPVSGLGKADTMPLALCIAILRATHQETT